MILLKQYKLLSKTMSGYSNTTYHLSDKKGENIDTSTISYNCSGLKQIGTKVSYYNLPFSYYLKSVTEEYQLI